MNLQLRTAERKQAKLRIGLFGPSGSGKTMSALKLAHGLADWEKVCIIDTESGSADLYSHLGPYNVLRIDAPFTPEKYIEAVKAAEQAGMEVIIVDSITHEWNGQGGVLEIADQLSLAAKNSFTVWGKLTPRHNRFIDSLLQSPCHIIACGRSKQEYVMNQVEKNGKMVNVPEKMGLKAITRDGFDYEMTITFDIAINHYATTSKDRTGIFMGRPEFVLSETNGDEIKQWNASAKPDPTDLKRQIMRQLTRIGVQTKDVELIKSDILGFTGLELTDDNFQEIVDKLGKIQPIDKVEEETVEVKAVEPSEVAETAPPEVLSEPVEKASIQQIKLLKSLILTKEGVDASEDETFLGVISLMLNREVLSVDSLTRTDASNLSQILMSKPSLKLDQE